MPTQIRSRAASILAIGLVQAAALGAAAQQPGGPAVTTPPVEVTAPTGVDETTAGPVRGYRALTTRSATKTETPVERVPQAVIVIPRKVIDDQGAVTQSEAMRNVSGVFPLDPLFAGQLTPTVRGQRAERFVDGLPNYYDIGARDLTVNVERLEVLKGPSSILYQGGASPVEEQREKREKKAKKHKKRLELKEEQPPGL